VSALPGRAVRVCRPGDAESGDRCALGTPSACGRPAGATALMGDDELAAAAGQDRGVLLVLTGSGKGKSSSAFGMLARALGHGMRVGLVQFIKGTFSTG